MIPCPCTDTLIKGGAGGAASCRGRPIWRQHNGTKYRRSCAIHRAGVGGGVLSEAVPLPSAIHVAPTPLNFEARGGVPRKTSLFIRWAHIGRCRRRSLLPGVSPEQLLLERV